MLLGVICSAGVFGVSAVENEGSAVDNGEDIGGEAVYSVIGNSEKVFYNADDIYDKTTEMTYDPRVGLYKLVLHEVQPQKDIRIKIVKNHSVNEDFDIQSTYFIFDVVSACDVLVTFDAETGATDVLGSGVVPFNVRDVVLLGFGNEAFSWDYTSEDDLLTEVESGVWEITYDDILVSPDPYCQVYFGVNPTRDTRPAVSYGFGNANNEVVDSGVETNAAILGSRNIAFKVDQNYSSVKLRLDIRNFDPKTKTGAKFTVTVTPPESAADTYGVQVVNTGFYPGPDEAPMTYNEETGLYELKAENAQPQTIEFYVVKNHSKSYGDPASGNKYPYILEINETCDVTITFDPSTETVNVYGDGIGQAVNPEIYSVIAAGNGEDTYLNGVNWDPADTSNAMKEVSDGVWEMTMTDIYAYNYYCVKFAVNSVDEDGNPLGNPWMYNFGTAEEKVYPADGQVIDAVYCGENCVFSVPQDGSSVTLRLDLRNFDFKTKQGAKLSITVTPPALLGDVNGDGVVDILDAVMIQKFAVDKVVFTDGQKQNADFNGDGVCDVLDATAIQKALVERNI